MHSSSSSSNNNRNIQCSLCDFSYQDPPISLPPIFQQSTFTVEHSGTGFDLLSTGSPTFQNNGTLIINPSSASAVSTWSAYLDTRGTITAKQGNLILKAGSEVWGPVTLSNAASVDWNYGRHSFNVGTNIQGNGTVKLTGSFIVFQ